MPQSKQARPLEGITIVDLSRVLAGPYCTMILAQLGARIIKVEMPGTGDDSPHLWPVRQRQVALLLGLEL